MKKWFISFVLALVAPLALAASSVDVIKPYARAVPPGQENSAMFMMLKNKSARPVSLISAQSSAADVVELHTHTMANGVMQMRQVSEINIPANDHVSLQPGSFHIMLIGLKKQLKEGDKVSVKLHFSSGEMAIVEMPVKAVQMMKMKH